MIKVKTLYEDLIVAPTIFPDGTSQIWKLPKDLLDENRTQYLITWYFEQERELIDLYSLVSLLRSDKNPNIQLAIPYLPYGRQDKSTDNNSTFNLSVFAKLINQLNFNRVITVDAHNPFLFEGLFYRSYSFCVPEFHKYVKEDFKPDYVVFPDKGACERYSANNFENVVVCWKERNQLTGVITNIELKSLNSEEKLKDDAKFLIVDDICDGGATFIQVAQTINENVFNPNIALCVTHGIFSKGRDHLLKNGISKIYTTDTLLKNYEDYKIKL